MIKDNFTFDIIQENEKSEKDIQTENQLNSIEVSISSSHSYVGILKAPQIFDISNFELSFEKADKPKIVKVVKKVIKKVNKVEEGVIDKKEADQNKESLSVEINSIKQINEISFVDQFSLFLSKNENKEILSTELFSVFSDPKEKPENYITPNEAFTYFTPEKTQIYVDPVAVVPETPKEIKVEAPTSEPKEEHKKNEKNSLKNYQKK